MTDGEDVRAALRALATDARTDDRPADTVADAGATLSDVRAAAAFVADGGLPRLRRAVEAADRAGDHATARHGRRVTAALERCRHAAADHFHSGHGTVLSGDGQGQRE